MNAIVYGEWKVQRDDRMFDARHPAPHLDMLANRTVVERQIPANRIGRWILQSLPKAFDRPRSTLIPIFPIIAPPSSQIQIRRVPKVRSCPVSRSRSTAAVSIRARYRHQSYRDAD